MTNYVPEIARQLSPENRLYPNPKNMYARLLAETGLIGFFLFIAFQFSLLGDVLTLLQKNDTLMRFLGVAGLFSWFAILIYNATQDSFAIPNIWINFGVLVGLTILGSQAERSHNGLLLDKGQSLDSYNWTAAGRRFGVRRVKRPKC